MATSPVTCSLSSAGPGAFTEGLADVFGFRVGTLADCEAELRSGRPVLVHGWWWPQYKRLLGHPGRLWVVWHSGWAGAELMGEHATLFDCLHIYAQRKIGGLFWVESRDVLPLGARALPAVWSPEKLPAPATPDKIERAVMVALGSPSPAKAVLPNIVAAAYAGAVVHLSELAMQWDRGQLLELLFQNRAHVVHVPKSRAEVRELLARMQLLVHVSASETAPYLPIEAICAGTPALISEHVPWSVLLSPWARERCLFGVKETARLKGEIEALLSNEADRARLLTEQRAVLQVHLKKSIPIARQALTEAGILVPE